MTLEKITRYGAFFKCSNPVVTSREVTRVAGTKCDGGHRFPASTYKHCPECGKPCEIIKETVTVTDDFNPMLDDDRLINVEMDSNSNVFYYFLNDPNGTHVCIDSEGPGFITVEPLESFRARLEAMVSFPGFVQQLKKVYRSVDVVTGIIVEYA